MDKDKSFFVDSDRIDAEQLRHLTCLSCSSFYHGTDQHPRVCNVITRP